MMTCRVDVTFEYSEHPPLTWSGHIMGANEYGICTRAIRQAKKIYSDKDWTSLTVYILERLSEPEEIGNVVQEPTGKPKRIVC